MAVSTASISTARRESVGRNERVVRRVTFDSAYVTGGEPVPASAFGLKRIRLAYQPQIVSGFAAGFAHCDALVQTDGSLLLRLRAAAGTQVAADADASTVVVDVMVEGY